MKQYRCEWISGRLYSYSLVEMSNQLDLRRSTNSRKTSPTTAQTFMEGPLKTEAGLLLKLLRRSFKPLERRGLGLGSVRGAITRVSPFSKKIPNVCSLSAGKGMGMEEPKPTFAYLVQQIKHLHPSFAYIHVVEPRIVGSNDGDEVYPDASNDFLREIWSPKRFITAGGYGSKLEAAFSAAEKQEGELVAFGRYFLSTPDLPVRLRKGLPLNPYNRDTFYLAGNGSGLGCTDYPFATEQGSQ